MLTERYSLLQRKLMNHNDIPPSLYRVSNVSSDVIGTYRRKLSSVKWLHSIYMKICQRVISDNARCCVTCNISSVYKYNIGKHAMDIKHELFENISVEGSLK